MKKVIAISSLFAALTLSGCMSTGPDSSALLSMDFENMNCDDINQTFQDYRDSSSNASSLANIASSVGVDTSAASAMQGQAAVAYNKAVNTARPIAKAKGCSTTF